MATRNERKRKAKQRWMEMQVIIEQSKPAPAIIEIWKPKHDVYEVPGAIRNHREAVQRLGVITKGKFYAKQAEPLAPLKGDEHRKGYYGYSKKR